MRKSDEQERLFDESELKLQELNCYDMSSGKLEQHYHQNRTRSSRTDQD
jgi:hypothetical protein